MRQSAARAAVRMALEYGDSGVYGSYWDWEKTFIAHWEVEVLDDGVNARKYIDENDIDVLACNFTDAARAFHVNRLLFRTEELLRNFCSDYDKVQPLLVEPPLDEEDFVKMEKQDDAFDPRPKREVYDMKTPGDTS